MIDMGSSSAQEAPPVCQQKNWPKRGTVPPIVALPPFGLYNCDAFDDGGTVPCTSFLAKIFLADREALLNHCHQPLQLRNFQPLYIIRIPFCVFTT